MPNTKTNDGGPVFPPQVIKDGDDLFREVTDYGFQSGLTLRDYFAAKAMAAILSTLHQGIQQRDLGDMAGDSYAVADAMLKARVRHGNLHL